MSPASGEHGRDALCVPVTRSLGLATCLIGLTALGRPKAPAVVAGVDAAAPEHAQGVAAGILWGARAVFELSVEPAEGADVGVACRGGAIEPAQVGCQALGLVKATAARILVGVGRRLAERVERAVAHAVAVGLGVARAAALVFRIRAELGHGPTLGNCAAGALGFTLSLVHYVNALGLAPTAAAPLALGRAIAASAEGGMWM
mmetsp:Transcript_39379/g.125659  ORF Transcript_39379/g.125659 Transcript_39379/m.125659 type:complete len:203 (-) Transcript_39379:311-919(-)